MARRRTIGENPLDILVPASPPAARAGRDARPRAGTSRRKPAAAVQPARSVRATFHLPAALVDEAKNAVVALSGPPVHLTLAGLVREALARELARLRKAHHKGKPWPPRAAPLVGGRPVSR